MRSVRTLDAALAPANIIGVIEEDGCAVIEGLLTREEISALQAEMEFHFSKIPNCRGDFYGHETKRFSGAIKKSQIARKMAIDPVILSVMDAFLLKNCCAYQLNLTQGIRIGP